MKSNLKSNNLNNIIYFLENKSLIFKDLENRIYRYKEIEIEKYYNNFRYDFVELTLDFRYNRYFKDSNDFEILSLPHPKLLYNYKFKKEHVREERPNQFIKTIRF